MVCRDRTADVLKIAAANNMRDNSGTPMHATVPQTSEEQADFLRTAGFVAAQLRETSNMSAKLAQLVSHRNVFEDHGPEIAEMSEAVKSNVAKLNQSLTTLKDKRRIAAYPQGNPDKHAEAVISSLQTRLFDTQNQFKGLLCERSQKVKTTRTRRQKYTTASDPSLLDDYDNADSSQRGMLLADPNNNLEYYTSREQDAKSVEKMVGELASMFEDFGKTLAEQEEVIINIEEEVMGAADDVNKATFELGKYLQSISSNRWLMARVFGVLFVFVLFFGLFVLK